MSISLVVNGRDYEVAAEADTPLLWVLRDYIELTGTKYGCGMGQCGACTVHIDGTPIRSCSLPVAAAVGKQITTVEGVESAAAKAVQEAWLQVEVPQCGYCQSGQIMTATALLESNPNPSDDDIDAAMDGNICRCATYVRIRKAIKTAAEQLG